MVPDFNLQPWHSCHKLIYVRPNPKTGVPLGHWPIPESFWPDHNTPALVSWQALNNFILLCFHTVGCLRSGLYDQFIRDGWASILFTWQTWVQTWAKCVEMSSCSQPPRSAHPVVQFSCMDCEPMVIDKLPFDKYELEPSPLTQFILERKSPHSCWQVQQIWRTVLQSVKIITTHAKAGILNLLLTEAVKYWCTSFLWFPEWCFLAWVNLSCSASVLHVVLRCLLAAAWSRMIWGSPLDTSRPAPL